MAAIAISGIYATCFVLLGYFIAFKQALLRDSEGGIGVRLIFTTLVEVGANKLRLSKGFGAQFLTEATALI